MNLMPKMKAKGGFLEQRIGRAAISYCLRNAGRTMHGKPIQSTCGSWSGRCPYLKLNLSYWDDESSSGWISVGAQNSKLLAFDAVCLVGSLISSMFHANWKLQRCSTLPLWEHSVGTTLVYTNLSSLARPSFAIQPWATDYNLLGKYKDSAPQIYLLP